MKVNTDQLLKVSTYAKKTDKSLTWIYKQIEEKELESVTIDGVAFIIVKDDK